MDTKQQEMTLVFDHELSEVWAEIRKQKNISFSEFIKDVLAKESLKNSTFSITESVKAISGTLKTQLDYKALREEMIDERVKDYENIR